MVVLVAAVIAASIVHITYVAVRKARSLICGWRYAYPK